MRSATGPTEFTAHGLKIAEFEYKSVKILSKVAKFEKPDAKYCCLLSNILSRTNVYQTITLTDFAHPLRNSIHYNAGVLLIYFDSMRKF